MTRREMRFDEHFEDVMGRLTGGGLLLGSYDAAGKANIMTIGWGSIGSIWGLPMWIVLVRPSRYTYRCIEHTGCFTVNVPTAAISSACEICGSRSGRDTDKFAEAGLTAEKASTVLAPTVAECPIVYECQVVHRNDLIPDKLADEILTGAYTSGDFHRVYYGKILAAYAAPQTADLLRP